MEELFSTFVRSIFSDNMIFTYYLGMCSFLAVVEGRRLAMAGPGICRGEPELPCPVDIHRDHCGFHAIG